MYFKCDIAKITVEQLAVCAALETLYREQSMSLTVLSLSPIVVELKPHLSAQMRERLFKNRVPLALQGYSAEIEGNTLVISKEKKSKPTRKHRNGGNKSDSDIQQQQ